MRKKTQKRAVYIIIILYLLTLSPLTVFSGETENSTENEEIHEFLHWPVEGVLDPYYLYTSNTKNGDYYISSPFGYRGSRWHSGLDLATWWVNRDILAAEAGVVIKIEERTTGYGNNIIIDHGEGLTTLYSHLETILVEGEQLVERGEAIGTAGATGDASGIHLHFEVRINNIAKDPLPFLGMESRPPINDSFNGAISYTAGRNVKVRGTGDGASREATEPKHGGEEGGRSVWWKWSPQDDGLYYFKTSDNNFPALLGVYTGSGLSELTAEAQSASASAEPFSLFKGESGREYHIAVDGKDGSSGFFHLAWDKAPAGTLSGTITDIFTGKGIPELGIKVTSKKYKYQAEIETNENGYYEFPFIPAGENQFIVIHENEIIETIDSFDIAANLPHTISIETANHNTTVEPDPPDDDIQYGHVLGNETITVADAVAVLRHIVGLIVLDDDQQKRGKVTGSEEISVNDAIAILRYIVGLINTLPLEKLSEQ